MPEPQMHPYQVTKRYGNISKYYGCGAKIDKKKTTRQKCFSPGHSAKNGNVQGTKIVAPGLLTRKCLPSQSFFLLEEKF